MTTTDDPCVDGCGQDAATIERLSGALIEVVAERDQLRATVGRIREMTDLTVGGYQPYALDIDDEVHLAVLLDDLRAALTPQNHPRSAVDAPEAPGRPERGEGAAGGDFGPCLPSLGERCGECHRCGGVR